MKVGIGYCNKNNAFISGKTVAEIALGVYITQDLKICLKFLEYH